MKSVRIFLGVIVFVFILLSVLEVGLRLSKRYLTYSESIGYKFEIEYGTEIPSYLWLQPANTTWDWGRGEFAYEYSINSLGYREREPDWDTAVNKIRLLVLGDSFAEGVGTPADSTWPRAIERKLKREYSDLHPAVLNFGVAGSDLFYALKAWEIHGRPLMPTHVILTINNSDFTDYIIRGGMSRFKPDGKAVFRKPPINLFFYRHFHIYRSYIHDVKECGWELINQEQIATYDSMMLVESDSVLAHMTASVEGAGGRFIVVTHPMPGEICDNNQVSPRTKKLCHAKKDYPNVDLLDALRGKTLSVDCSDIGWPVDGHFNSHGYTIFADVLWEEMIRYDSLFYTSDLD